MNIEQQIHLQKTIANFSSPSSLPLNYFALGCVRTPKSLERDLPCILCICEFYPNSIYFAIGIFTRLLRKLENWQVQLSISDRVNQKLQI